MSTTGEKVAKILQKYKVSKAPKGYVVLLNDAHLELSEDIRKLQQHFIEPKELETAHTDSIVRWACGSRVSVLEEAVSDARVANLLKSIAKYAFLEKRPRIIEEVYRAWQAAMRDLHYPAEYEMTQQVIDGVHAITIRQKTVPAVTQEATTRSGEALLELIRWGREGAGEEQQQGGENGSSAV